MGKKKNWDQIRNQKITDTVKYRDVYEQQQLERGKREAKGNMLGRNILNGFISLFAFILLWVIVSFVQMLSTGKGERELSMNPAYTWIYVDEHYLNVNDSNDRITVDEFQVLLDEFNAHYNPSLPPVEKPVKPEDPETSGNYMHPTKDSGVVDASKWVDVGGREVDINALKLQYQIDLAAYEQQLIEYNDYIKYTVSPEWNESTGQGTYRYIRAHYRNRTDTSNAIEVSDYEKLVSEYNAKLKAGKFSEDELDIPGMPYDPAKWYKEEALNEDGEVIKDENSSESDTPPVVTSKYCINNIDVCDCVAQTGGKYHHHLKSGIHRVSDGWFDYNDNPVDAAIVEASMNGGVAEQPSTGEGVTPDGDYVYVDRNVQYRHILDGHILTQLEYEELRNKYVQDAEAYLAAYQLHRETYHPDDIDGTNKIFTMSPNLMKVLISLGGSALIFGILYMLFKKNLDAQNLLLDTADINQYENDQHVALPEEVQRNYDWFPDVGAHSAVQVSSMISHMALTNKGLKQIEFAKRADKDILDEDGDIEYYKGEILQDENGNPITSKVPIIDEEFMESLFDASGAPKDKNIRKKYDTTKIPYNPDGSNRDKLGKYDTVADLINDDWEFPLYEPQRPGGAYIVDTAPVNTMV